MSTFVKGKNDILSKNSETAVIPIGTTAVSLFKIQITTSALYCGVWLIRWQQKDVINYRATLLFVY